MTTTEAKRAITNVNGPVTRFVAIDQAMHLAAKGGDPVALANALWELLPVLSDDVYESES